MIHRFSCVRAVCIVLACVTTLIGARAANASCVGDCDASQSVTVDEIVLGVNIALGVGRIQDCLPFDSNADGEVTVDEIITSVQFALTGCPVETPTVPPTPVPTDTSTPVPSPTVTLTASATATTTPTLGLTPIFPSNYRQTYSEVRGCRSSTEHGGVYIRVLTNPIAAQPYLSNENPLPVGSIVIKEEFSGPGCQTGDLIRWRAMRKEAPGYDPDDGDWHWQWVDLTGQVVFNDKQTCIGCHARSECVARDFMCTVPGSPLGGLSLVLQDQKAALLSISGRSETDVIAVGGDPEDGNGPLVLRYDGAKWRRLATKSTGNLWWISVTPIDGAFYMVGEHGLVLKFDPDNETFEKIPTPGDRILYGVWGSTANDIWVVGGDPESPDQGGMIWHYDGVEWDQVDTTAIREGGVPTLFKVWGRNPSEVYAVGMRGTVLQFDGTKWSQVVSNTVRPLFTVHGSSKSVVASGGFIDGVIIEKEGDQFVRRDDGMILQMNGIFAGENGVSVAVGITGTASARNETTWSAIDTQVNTLLDFHATWLDPQGGVWAVGGDLTIALSRGMLAYGGGLTVSSVVEDVPPCQPGTFSPDATVSYMNDVLPILSRSGCQSSTCHGGPFPPSAYDMRTYEGLFGQGLEAKVLKTCDVTPGDPDKSYLIEKLLVDPRLGARMPGVLPPLSDEDIQLIRTWILEGAGDDRPPTPRPTPTSAVTPTPTKDPALTPVPTLSPDCSIPGTICTVAGTGLSLFDGDGRGATQTSLYFPIDLAFDTTDAPLILDWNNLRLRRIKPDGRVETIMGTDVEDIPVDGMLAKDTPLHHASDVEIDPTGIMYLAGDHAPIVFRVGLDHRVLTIAGSGQVGYSGDNGPARAAKLGTPFGVYPDGEGGCYIADVATHTVRLVDRKGVIRTVAGSGERGYTGDGGPASQATLGGPVRLTKDAEGNLYIVESYNHVIRKIDRHGIISTFAGNGVGAYKGDGGAATAASLNGPYDAHFAPDGSLFIADSDNSVIRKVDPAGVITTVAGTGEDGYGGDHGSALSAKLSCPSAVEPAPDGSLWIADSCNHRVRRVAAAVE